MTAAQPESGLSAGKPSSRQWFVCDMDDGVLRVTPTRRAAVRWLCLLLGGTVQARHSYGPGSFEYVVGVDGEDHSSAFVVRGDRMVAARWDPQQVPLYPLADDEFEQVDRPVEGLGQSADRRA